MEITITGANALTYPSLNIWNWMVALYLFLVGLAAGLLIMSAVVNLKGRNLDHRERADSFRAAIMAPLVLMLGMFFIWLDLENKAHSFWIFLSFSLTSPMSWGAWGLSLTVPISLLHGLSVMQDDYRHWLRFGPLKDLSRKLCPYMPILARICLALGVFLGIYTGMSLSVFVARPLWNSALLPILFLASALSNGAALIIIMAETRSAQFFFTRANIWFICAELVIIFLFFLGHLTSSAPQRESIMPFLSYSHEYFLLGVFLIVFALVFPLGLALKVLKLKRNPYAQGSKALHFRMKMSACMVLAGGLVMSLGWVYLGQLSKLA